MRRRRFQFSLRRLLAATATAALSLALVTSINYPIAEISWNLLCTFLVASLMIGLTIGVIACERWKTIAISVAVWGCFGVAFDIFLCWMSDVARDLGGS